MVEVRITYNWKMKIYMLQLIVKNAYVCINGPRPKTAKLRQMRVRDQENKTKIF